MAKSVLVGCMASCSMVTAAVIGSPAMAQSSGQDSASGDAELQCGEGIICVTARRTSEDISKVPVTVSILSSETLTEANITTESDLRSISPGLTVRASASGNQLNYTIRGQSQDAFSNVRPGVLPYVNEVQIASAGGASTAFYDLANIQVLKGPQGTLFGRSATGGAVLFETRKADIDTVEGYGSLLVGTYDALKIEGAVNVPIVPGSVGLRVAGFHSQRDGYQKNLLDFMAPGGALNAVVPFVTDPSGNPYTGPGGPDYSGQDLPDQDYGDYERWGVRGSLAMEFGNLRNDLVVDYYKATGRSI